MSSTSLYRKYRPKTFKDIIGQNHIIEALEGALKLGNLSHAYLFAGSRGTGKTSVARIVADQIGTSVNDLYEMDAASNRGIDDIRGIKESVQSLPFDSKYKVYIIDEVHMLTKDAFNALLKTLEEPPEYVVFILATTEPEKLPDTVVSRCQSYYFKNPNQQILTDMVKKVAKKEGFELEKSSAELIALLGDGSFRDALGVLQKVIGASEDKKISVEEVEKITGAPKSELVNDVILAVSLPDSERGLFAVRKAADSNVDMEMFLKMILQKLRFALLLKISKEGSGIKEELPEDDFNFLQEVVNKEDSKISSKTLLRFLEAHEQLRISYISQLPIELAIIDLSN